MIAGQTFLLFLVILLSWFVWFFFSWQKERFVNNANYASSSTLSLVMQGFLNGNISQQSTGITTQLLLV